VAAFIADHGRRLSLDSPYLFMDSTNSIDVGGEIWAVDDNFSIRRWIGDEESTLYLEFTLQNNNDGWMGVTFHEFMFPGDSIIAWWDEQQRSGFCLDDYNPGIPTLANFPAPMRDDNPLLFLGGGDPLDNQENVTLVSASDADGTITVTCRRPLATGDIFDYQFELGDQLNVVAAYNARLDWNPAFNAQQPTHTAYGASRWIMGSVG
jgi:hypothetical protein